jgi:DNA-binding response OmpR family regulator
MKTILIVEDDPKIVAALEIRFQAAGHSTLAAGDAMSGLSKAVQHRPDLIVLDITLPAGNGLQLAEKLKGLPETRRTPFIFITANKDPDLRARAMDLGAAGLFEKPYNADELLAVAGHALGETGMFRRLIARFAPATETLAAKFKMGRKKILIVEDDQKIALALAVRLKSAGYETSTAFDAVGGVSEAMRFQPDLVLLDVSLPAGSGFTVAERVRSVMPAATPIIFLTASRQPGLMERAQELGAAGYFEKPYEAEALLTAVHQHIGPCARA